MYVFLYNTIKWPYQPKYSPSYLLESCGSIKQRMRLAYIELLSMNIVYMFAYNIELLIQDRHYSTRSFFLPFVFPRFYIAMQHYNVDS